MGARRTKVILREVAGRRLWVEPAPGCNRVDRHWCFEVNEYLPHEPPAAQAWFRQFGAWNGHTFIFTRYREGV